MPSVKRTFSDLNVFRREYLRNKTGFFFSLVFPIILIAIFGAIFSGGGGGPTTVYVQNQDSNSQISTAFMSAMNSTNITELIVVPVNVNFSQYLLDHSSSIGMVIPGGFENDFLQGKQVNVTIYSNPTDSSAYIVLGVTNGVINAFNLQRANASAVIGMQSLTIKSQNYKYIDFLIPGLVGFSILTSPMFSMVNISAEYKKTKLFKQLSLTPLTKGEWLASKVIWYVILSAISFVLMVFVGTFAFGAHVAVTFWIIPFLVLGPLLFVSLGMLVGTVTKSVESAGVVGNIITFPMMFLSGTFFPVSAMPTYLQGFAHVLPLYYLIDGLNEVMIYDNYSQALIDAAILLVLSSLIFALAIRFFKWRED
ncbi:MAG: ABC transporter permease [Nitrososphaerales archaeon]